MKCMNCGSAFETPYCGHCGQEAASGKVTIGELKRTALRAFSLERGWLHTIVDLSVRPSAMIRDYLDGKRVVYIGPVRYAVTVCSLYIAFALLLPAMPVAGDPTLQANIQQAMETYTRHFFLPVLMLTAPFYALLSWGLFRKSGLTYAEHVTMQFYVFGQAILFWAPFEAVGRCVPGSYLALTLVGLIGYMLYATWVLRGVCARGLWSAIGGGLLIQLVGLVFVQLILILVVAALVVAQAIRAGGSPG